MPRKSPTSRQEFQPRSHADSKRVRQRGMCYDCGLALGTNTTDGHYHSYMIDNGGRVAFAADICCDCAGHE